MSPMYVWGDRTPIKEPSRRGARARRQISPGIFFTDAEVLQEILHRIVRFSERGQQAQPSDFAQFATLMRGPNRAHHSQKTSLARR